MAERQDQRPVQRERRKRATKARLRDAAAALAQSQQPAQITVDAICAEAGVSRRTFFNHFDTKDEVFLAWDDADDARFVELIAARPSSESAVRAALRALAPVVFDVAESGFADIVHDITGRNPVLHPQATQIYTRFVHAVALGIAQRQRLPEDSYTVQLGAVTVTAALRLMTHASASADDTERERYLEEACRTLDLGFLTTELDRR
ncbi:TetR/AcrR family transcriptional regulator [Streptomyces sp. NPDC048111]|uniref:TetR/AcrR family transcriptional regulator n=1 Tax=Streptomyces sp. NPDC048111 TaxID=3365500 RepID=UPI003722BC6C